MKGLSTLGIELQGLVRAQNFNRLCGKYVNLPLDAILIAFKKTYPQFLVVDMTKLKWFYNSIALWIFISSIRKDLLKFQKSAYYCLFNFRYEVLNFQEKVSKLYMELKEDNWEVLDANR